MIFICDKDHTKLLIRLLLFSTIQPFTDSAYSLRYLFWVNDKVNDIGIDYTFHCPTLFPCISIITANAMLFNACFAMYTHIVIPLIFHCLNDVFVNIYKCRFPSFCIRKSFPNKTLA